MSFTAQQKMTRLLRGSEISRCISVAAKLGIADLLAEGPKTGTELAEITGADADALNVMLRLLALEEIFVEKGGFWHLTELSETLTTRPEGSVKGLAIMKGMPFHWNAWGAAERTIMTGESAFKHVHGMTTYEYFQKNMPDGAIFDNAMAEVGSANVSPLLCMLSSFTGIHTVVDVGGGSGDLLVKVLKARPDLHGVLFDRPDVVQRASARIREEGLCDRCALGGGDFFEFVPAADVLIVCNVIHNWKDEQATILLKNCRRALRENGILFLMAHVLPSEAAIIMNMTMRIMEDGKERTEEEFHGLLGATGFAIERILDPRRALSIIQARPL